MGCYAYDAHAFCRNKCIVHIAGLSECNIVAITDVSMFLPPKRGKPRNTVCSESFIEVTEINLRMEELYASTVRKS